MRTHEPLELLQFRGMTDQHVLRYGIEMNEWAAKWFERTAEDLEERAATPVGARKEA